ncbi:MAG: magnesium/cobalt transporter CorA [Spirochaetes bacterium]|nr:magnesium/cobalt transporter CorA [Spirochaetota bacterium]
MSRYVKKRTKSLGQPPGSLVHIGEIVTEKTKITVIDYNEKKYEHKTDVPLKECSRYFDSATVTWINIDGVHDVSVIERIGEMYRIHPLLLEDVMHTGQRPKIEDFGEHLFIILKMLTFNEEKDRVEAEQVSLLLGKNFVISFQEREGDVFTSIRERIQGDKGRIRKMGADYLAYSLMDSIVDHYFIILENFGDKIEELEEELLEDTSPKTSSRIHSLKRELVFLRRSVWPLRDIVNSLERGENALIKKSTLIFLRDVYDHTINIIDTIEAYRDSTSGMLDTYLTQMSNRMNETMKVLTVIATIFIPLTFIAGIYGMNFKFMPELGWKWAYPTVWGVIALVGVGMVIFFRRRRWL